MKIYLLIKREYGYEGDIEMEEITAYVNEADANKIVEAFNNYGNQVKALDDEYARLDLYHHPELKGKITKLRRANRAKKEALYYAHREQSAWEDMFVQAVEVNN